MSDLYVSGFRHFDFRLNSNRIVHSAMLLLAAVTSASSKTKRSNVEFASKGDLRPLIQWSPSSSIFTKQSSIPPSLINNANINS